MTTWNPSAPPPAGFYPPGQQDPKQGFYGGPGYPQGQPGYPQGTPGYPQGQPGYPQGQPGYPKEQGGYPGYPSGPEPGYPAPSQPGYPGGPPQYSSGFGQPPVVPPPYSHIPSANISQPAMYGGTSYPEDPLNEHVENFDFSDKSIRRAFIRKVYAILMCQLLITLSFVTLFTFHEPTRTYVRRNTAIWWIAFGVMIVTLIAMSCCTSVRRKSPMNFIFLFLFTLAESFLLGAVASSYQGDAVMMAVGLTAAVCLGLTLFAFQTKWDFTAMGGILLVCAIILLIFGIVAIIFPGKTITLVYASLGALLFSVYLVYDTQLMLGGKHKYSISPEEYIFAALNLYLDIVNIFIYILTIIGASRN
uniref:Uncharacterized protein n=2 Tax=Timema TaxID=61471 RepID=A0A7R9FF25_9NEOP|nr:unnamed protein product [Timema bartmani]CAD7451940.1 unnamed protein product [Timema tahoe]